MENNCIKLLEFDKIAQETSPKMAYLIKRVVLVEKIL